MSYQPVDVEIRVTAEGDITPLRFTWRGSWYSIAQIGRTWADEDGDHWLIMAALPHLIVDLVHTHENRWLAEQKSSRPRIV
ncbi:MAG: hypothetical protein JXB07_04545 [Anaerolineae bacterium]|nr:hypothetical protein [Anaerolineae bacterium]